MRDVMKWSLLVVAGLVVSATLARAAEDATNPATAPAATGAISGKVVDADGKAVAGAAVKILVLGPTQVVAPVTVGEGVTDKDGVFKISGINDGSHLVTVRTEGSAGSRPRVVVADGKETVIKDAIVVQARPGK